MPVSVSCAPRLNLAGLVAVLLLVCLSARPVWADEEADLRYQITSAVKSAWDKEDFQALESMENLYISPAQRTLSGKRRLALFDSALSSLMTIEWPKDWNKTVTTKTTVDHGPYPKYFGEANKRWDVVEEKLKRWAAKFPQSPNPSIALAEYYGNRAWFFRGSFFASEVFEEAWPIFYQNLDAAERVLMRTRSVSVRNPLWFDVMFGVYGAKSPQPTLSERKRLIEDLLENGQGYPPAYQMVLHFLEPRWGGSPRQVEDFARLANAKSLKQERGAMYARLYWNFEATYRYGTRFFDETSADWPTLKTSFEKLVADYPTPRNFTGFAMFACMANDVAGARDLLKRAGTDFYLPAWVPELRERCATK